MNRPALLILLALLPLSLVAMAPAAAAERCVGLQRGLPANDVAIPGFSTPGVDTPGYETTVDPPRVGPVDIDPVTVGVPGVHVEGQERERQVVLERETFGPFVVCV